MKKFISLVMLTFFVYTLNAQGFYEQDKIESNEAFVEQGYSKIKVAIRHHGVSNNCVCPDCVLPACKCPLGICVGRGGGKVLEFDEELNDEERANGFGTIWIKVVDDKIHIIFNDVFSDDDGVIPIDYDVDFNSENIEGYDLQTLRLQGGDYEVNFSKYLFGELVLDIITDL